ncbi:MAG: regulatory protein RecX [Deltaproteobacteria bacterium]|nr:regulatory protein RecX [Deltaproteobacteria bacterium]
MSRGASRAPVTAWWKAQELLARRAHGTRELSDKLRQRGFADADIEPVIERLTAKGILDDLAFATRLAEEYFHRRGYGWHAILLRLRKKGLSNDVAVQVCDGLFNALSDDELIAVMRRLLEKKKRRETDRRKLFAWLRNRGFRGREINLVLDRNDNFLTPED